ncbi:MAG TPA: translation initiation factor IF-2, partial [Thermodesulfovibrionales bacterium]|nr:translation initiation factor IF-2 [Thermodesulfovibrionales bacterium]
MSKLRVYELAKKLGASNKEVITELSKLGVLVKTHSSSIEAEVAKKIEGIFKGKQKPRGKAVPPVQPAAKKAVPVRAEKPEKKPEAKEPKKEIKKEVKGKTREEVKEEVKVKEEARKEIKETPKREVQEEIREEAHGEVKEEVVTPAEEVKVGEEPISPLEEVELKVPERFKKDIETEKVEKFKAKPAMQRAFQAVRKIEPKKWHEAKPFKKQVKDRPGLKVAEKPQPAPITAPRKKLLKIHEGITVKEFAELISVKLPDVIKKFMELGYMPTINQPVDMDAALLVAEGFGVKLEVAVAEEEPLLEEAAEDTTALVHRPPVVTIMGHVDHGKTSLLDAVRETKVTETEAGGITQHIGAYKVTFKGKEIVFLDTPGHEAFTSLRARGAKVTDVVVLVVAADDGVMPQTVEAIDHARAANVPIIVAVNKIDKPEANPTKVKNELSSRGIVSEEWGGQNIFVEVSAKKRIGLENLLEMILLQSDVMELKADPNRKAKGTIIESRLDRGRGPMATVLVQNGTLKVGDVFLSGTNYGKVRALIDDTGRRINEAGPSTPVEVIGFSDVPTAGDVFTVVDDEKKARQIAMARQQKQRLAEMARARKLTLDDLYSKIKEGEIRELNIIIKGDVQGSVEALKEAFEQIVHTQVKVKVIHASVGGIN